MKIFDSRKSVVLAVILGASLGMSACSKQDETPVEKATDKVGDALDMRDNEKSKDAAEDAKEAIESAGEAIKDGAQEVKEEVKEVVGSE